MIDDDDVMRGHEPDGFPREPGPQVTRSQGRYVPPAYVWEQLSPAQQEKRLAAQRRNARVMALVLGAFVILMFAISIAKIGIHWAR